VAFPIKVLSEHEKHHKDEEDKECNGLEKKAGNSELASIQKFK
jgi:hypothetical protein